MSLLHLSFHSWNLLHIFDHHSRIQHLFLPYYSFWIHPRTTYLDLQSSTFLRYVFKLFIKLTITLEIAIYKISFIKATIFPLKSAFAILFPFIEGTNIPCSSIIPTLFTLTMLKIIQPITCVRGILSILKSSITIRHVIFPLSFINISIGMSHSSFSTTFALLELSLILWTIWP